MVTNSRVLCCDFYATPTMCTPYYQSIDSILYQKFAFWTYSPFLHEVSLLYFSRNNLLRVLTAMYVDILISNVFNLNKHFSFLFFLSFLKQCTQHYNRSSICNVTLKHTRNYTTATTSTWSSCLICVSSVENILEPWVRSTLVSYMDLMVLGITTYVWISRLRLICIRGWVAQSVRYLRLDIM